MKFLKNLKVLNKLILLIVLFTLSILSIAYVSITGLSNTVESSDTIYNEQLIPNQLFSEISINNRSINSN